MNASQDTETAVTHVTTAKLSPLDAAYLAPRGRPNPIKALNVWDAPDPLYRPSISLDPGNITKHDLYSDEDASSVALAVNAMQALHDAVAKVVDARKSIQGDPTLTDAAKLLSIDALHTKVGPAATRRVDEARAALDRAITEAEATLRAPIRSASATPVATEIRTFVRGLSLGDRQQLLTRAISEGDGVTVGAVLGGVPAYLSGLEPPAVATLTHMWHAKQNPALVRKLDLMKMARDKLEAAGSIYIANIENAIGARPSTVAKLRAAQQKARTVIGAIA